MSATQICMDILVKKAVELETEAGEVFGAIAARAARLSGYCEQGIETVLSPLTLGIVEKDMKLALALVAEAAALRRGAKEIGV